MSVSEVALIFRPIWESIEEKAYFNSELKSAIDKIKTIAERNPALAKEARDAINDLNARVSMNDFYVERRRNQEGAAFTLINCTMLGDKEGVKYLVRVGVDVNQLVCGRSALHYAVANSKTALVEMLLKSPLIDLDLKTAINKKTIFDLVRDEEIKTLLENARKRL